MIHIVHMIHRRYPQYARPLVAALVAASMPLLLAGIWMLLR